MLNLYDEIFSLINPIVDSYAEHYPADKERIYPYAEFNFPNVVKNNEFSNLNQLYIDIWDNKSGQVEEIETITDNIVNALNGQKINTNDMFIQIYKDKPFRLKLDDSDINIQRRELRFIVKVYEK
jgi:hypothetical protein